MKNMLLPLILFLTVSAGRGQQDLNSDSIVIDGNQRTFHFIKPSSKNASLVFVLHGSGGGGKQMANQTDALRRRAKSDNILLAYPDGYKKFWNECRKVATTEANQLDIDEVEFFSKMIEYFKKNFDIDENRVFVVGTSGGGHMAYKLAMIAPEKFAAITAIIANLPDDQNMDCHPSGVALPVMIINGTDDQVNPYNGGMMQTGNFKAGTVRSTEQTFHYWASLAGYGGSPTRSALPDREKDGKTIEKYTFKEGDKPEVILLKVIGGKHDYPKDVDVHLEAWDFFKRVGSANQRTNR